MKRRLNTLRITNFVGLSRAEIVFAKPVTMFFGPNNAGKSSIKDAINFVLTGKARNAGTFTAAKNLAHKDRRGMSVELGYQVEGLTEINTKKRTAKNLSKDVDTNILLPYCIDGMSFIELTAKERGRIFASVLDAGNVDIIKAAIQKHVTFSMELRNEVKAICQNVLDVDAIREAVIEIRKNLKRERGVYADMTEPAKSDFKIPADTDAANVEAQIKKLQQSKVVLMQEHGAALAHNQHQEKLHNIKKDIAAARKNLREIPDGASDLILNLQMKEELKPFLERMVEAGICPCCGKSIGPEDAVKRGNEIYAAIDKDNAKLGDINEHLAINSELNARIERLTTKQTELKKIELASPKRSEDKIQVEIDGINDKLTELNTVERNLQRYDGALQTYDEFADKEPKLNDRIEECNTIDKLLADGGPVKAEIAKAGRTLPINADLVSAWGIDSFEWTTNGDISYLGKPIEAASVSEKYRIAQVLSLALAEIGDIGFACVDGYEVLCQPHAGQFVEAVMNSKLNNVLLFVSMSPNKTRGLLQPSYKFGPNINAYGVTDGEVRAASS